MDTDSMPLLMLLGCRLIFLPVFILLRRSPTFLWMTGPRTTDGDSDRNSLASLRHGKTSPLSKAQANTFN